MVDKLQQNHFNNDTPDVDIDFLVIEKKGNKEIFEEKFITIESVEGVKIQETALNILRSIYIATTKMGRDFDKNGVLHIPLSDGYKMTDFVVKQGDSVISELEKYMSSKGFNTNGGDIFESIQNIEELKLWHGDISRKDCQITKDGNIKYYHNPKKGLTTEIGDGRVGYSLGATQSPFMDLQIMKEKTKIPQSLGEIDFFVNYINAKNGTKKIITDPITGNRYKNYVEYDLNINGVEFKGDKHWNIQRFLIDPHYKFFNVKKIDARRNALYDLYKYFLFVEEGNRNTAWDKANELMLEYVDPIINSKFNKWYAENSDKIYRGGTFHDSSFSVGNFDEYFKTNNNIYKSNDKSSFIEDILIYNQAVYSGDVEGNPYTRKEIYDILVEYNINFRQKSKEESHKIVDNDIESKINQYKKEIEKTKKQELKEYKVLQEGNYPKEFNDWESIKQQIWSDKNPDKIKIIQHELTQEEKNKQIISLSRFKFAENK